MRVWNAGGASDSAICTGSSARISGTDVSSSREAIGASTFNCSVLLPAWLSSRAWISGCRGNLSSKSLFPSLTHQLAPTFKTNRMWSVTSLESKVAHTSWTLSSVDSKSTERANCHPPWSSTAPKCNMSLSAERARKCMLQIPARFVDATAISMTPRTTHSAVLDRESASNVSFTRCTAASRRLRGGGTMTLKLLFSFLIHS
mmetsp:Transcript_50701/g.135126  ORF Transcript_50701/g.135126 Transcript_50701/m.135126 type:complete len:202 (-) Transcript_50701:345-950(-)